jgi:hypothetical protein
MWTPLPLNVPSPYNIRYGLMGRRELTSGDVRKLVFKSIGMIVKTQRELKLQICPNIDETRERLRDGIFRAEQMPRNKVKPYHMDYGSFDPPATITLDSRLPFSDEPLHMPELPQTLEHFTATHEVIHADDYTGGDWMFTATREHILCEHRDKLEKGMRIIETERGSECIRSSEDLACLWAMQYVDMITHYRAYVVLRHHQFPKLDQIWRHLHNDFFQSNLLTQIEREKDIRYVFDHIIRRAGEYCIVDALKESVSIGKSKASRYTI